jgi:hypothetical protein
MIVSTYDVLLINSSCEPHQISSNADLSYLLRAMIALVFLLLALAVHPAVAQSR